MHASGSSPSGSTATFTCSPWASSSSPDRDAAPAPAGSGSKLTITFGANRLSNRTCRSPKAVPQQATTGATPAWTACARSKYPSTSTACPASRMARFERWSPYSVRPFE